MDQYPLFTLLSHPITSRESEFIVQIEALSTPECQEGVQRPGGQRKEGLGVVHYVQVEYYQRHLKESESTPNIYDQI